MSLWWRKLINYSYIHSIISKPIKRRSFIVKSTATACFAGGTFLFCSTLIQLDRPQRQNTSITNNTPVALAGAALRFLRTCRIGIIISMDYWITTFILDPNAGNYKQRLSRLHTRNAERILHGCLVNGGTYIKIGQGLVSLSHILPKEYITTLSWLQDKCLVMGEGEVEEIFREEFGMSPDEIFKSFTPEPIAAASLAQVFVATTKNGEKVAVKVQYKDLQDRFYSDVSTIDFLLRITAFCHPTFDFSWILEDLTENLRSELDFKKEGKNAEKCAHDLDHLSYVYVPKVYWEHCSKRVMVTEFIDGVKINDKKRLKEEGHSLTDIDTKMFQAFGEQIFQNGFVHADPHPGNVFVRKRHNQTQLVLLDHGLYQQLTEEERTYLSHFWQAVVVRDHQKMDKYSKALGVQDYSEFAEVLTQTPLRKEFKFVTKITQDDIDYITEVAEHRLDIITKTLKEMPRSLLFVVRNLNTLRSIAHDHGNPVNRYRILARVAAKMAFKERDSFWKKLSAFPMRVSFEYQLLLHRCWLNFIKCYLIFLELVGRSPDTSKVLAIMS